MGTTTMGVKLDDATRERIKTAASRIDRTPHWLIKQAIFNYLERLENDDALPELPSLLAGAANEGEESTTPQNEAHQPFTEFAEQILPQSVSRAAITAAYRRAETDAVPMLMEQARLPQPIAEQAHKLAYSWPTNCVTRRPPAAAPGWYKVYCRNSPFLHRKASR